MSVRPNTPSALRLRARPCCAKEDPNGAAICNLYAAQRYGLGILAERIEDAPGNTARFLALGNYSNPPTGDDKTSLLFAVSDRPGALLAALGALSSTNMTRIESRPNRLFSWQYLFYADIEGHRDDSTSGRPWMPWRRT